MGEPLYTTWHVHVKQENGSAGFDESTTREYCTTGAAYQSWPTRGSYDFPASSLLHLAMSPRALCPLTLPYMTPNTLISGPHSILMTSLPFIAHTLTIEESRGTHPTLLTTPHISTDSATSISACLTLREEVG